MSLYFFHIHDSAGVVPDDDGMMLPDLEAARREAILSIREILAQVEFRLSDEYSYIAIADDRGATIMRVPFREGLILSS